jgi:two-component system, NtrC family, response regulator AtoC
MIGATLLFVSRESREHLFSGVSGVESRATVVQARSRRGALLHASQRSIQVVVVDGDGAGIEVDQLVTELRRALPEAEILVTFRSPSIAPAVAAMRSGASDVLATRSAALDEAVSRALDTAETWTTVATLVGGGAASPGLVGRSASIAGVRATLQRLSESTSTTVLIEGETGTGKEVVARLLHERGPRASGPFIKINCAALPAAMVESELFGHERGAFTSASMANPGLVESARGGTLFFDEIGELPLELQAKLLRFLEQRTYRRVGGTEELDADVRVVAATNVDLERRLREGLFRSDLFFRLGVVRIQIDPLRKRPEDIPPLAATFVAQQDLALGRQVRGVSAAALRVLGEHPWPGNIRELRNVVQRAFVLFPEMRELDARHLPAGLGAAGRPPRLALEALPGLQLAERLAIGAAVESVGGNLAEAARRLGLGRFALLYRMRKHGLSARPGLTPAAPVRDRAESQGS